MLLYELGFDEGLLNPLRECYLSVIAGRLFPDCGGATLDSHRAFVVSYGLEADRDLDLHYDNAEVTVNISLDDEFQEGELYIGRMYTDRQSMPRSSASEFCACQHRLGCGLLHRGQQMHGALPLTAGVRHNLIIWMRSSVTRNHLCPMCQKQPDLVKVSGTGDGFSVSNVDVCSLVWHDPVELTTLWDLVIITGDIINSINNGLNLCKKNCRSQRVHVCVMILLYYSGDVL